MKVRQTAVCLAAVAGVGLLATWYGQSTDQALEKQAANGDLSASTRLSNRLPESEESILRLLASPDPEVRRRTVYGKTFRLTPGLQEGFFAYAKGSSDRMADRQEAIDAVAYGPDDYLDRFIELYESQEQHLRFIGAWGIMRYDFWKGQNSNPRAVQYLESIRADRDQAIREIVAIRS